MQAVLLPVLQPRQRDTDAVGFTWRQNVSVRRYRQVLPSGVTQVIVHPSEASMLQGWLDWLRNADPDVLNVFQASPSPSWSVTAVLQPSGLNIRDSSLVVRHNMAPSRHVRCAVPGLAGAA